MFDENDEIATTFVPVKDTYENSRRWIGLVGISVGEIAR